MFNENLLFFKMSTIIFYYSLQPLCYIAINGMQHILGYFFPNFNQFFSNYQLKCEELSKLSFSGNFKLKNP